MEKRKCEFCGIMVKTGIAGMENGNVICSDYCNLALHNYLIAVQKGKDRHRG